jgi:hypothetical protein
MRRSRVAIEVHSVIAACTAWPLAWSSRVVTTPPAITPVSGIADDLGPIGRLQDGDGIADLQRHQAQGPRLRTAFVHGVGDEPVLVAGALSVLMDRFIAARVAISTVMKPQDLICPKPDGLYCPPGDFYIDPVRPVDRAVITHGHADHARAGHGVVAATPETLAIMAERYGEDFAGRRPGRGLWRDLHPQRRRGRAGPGRPRAGLGPGGGPLEGHDHRRLRRLQAPPRPHLPGLRARALRRLRHRGDLRPAGLPPSRRQGRGGGPAEVGRAVPRALAHRRGLRPGQGPAGDQAAARGGLGQDHPRAWGDGAAEPAL